MYPRALQSPKGRSLAVPSMLFLYVPQSLDNIATAEGTCTSGTRDLWPVFSSMPFAIQAASPNFWHSRQPPACLYT